MNNALINLLTLNGAKAYLAAAGLIFTGVSGYLNGDTTIGETALIILNGLGVAGIRHAVAKSAAAK